MLLPASKMAACSIAKLRVEWIVGGWAPGVRTISSRVLFHSMTWFTDCEAEAGRSSLLVMLPKPVTELKKPAHRNASAKTLFTIEFTSPIGFSENSRAWPDHRCRGIGIPTPWITEKGELYSNSGRDFTIHVL